MKKPKFEEFNDGLVNIYEVNENEELVQKKKGARFGEENVSIERHYAAKASGNELEKMIHIQMSRDITAHDIAIIRDKQYDIEKAEHFKTNMPPITKLSLRILETSKERDIVNDES